MSIEDASTTFDHASRSDLFSNSDFRETVDESSATVDIGCSPVSKDYWYGKMYFQCVLAQELLRQTPVEESIQSIDSKLGTAIQEFPYDEMVSTLRAQGIITSQMSFFGQQRSHSETLVMLIGSICRQGGQREKRALLTALRKGEAGLNLASRHGGESPSSQETEHQRIPSLHDSESVTDIGLYTLILKEHGDQIGVVPCYEIKTITLVPPHFIATLSFNRTLFEGQGSSKKEAKHRASKRACESLHLRFR